MPSSPLTLLDRLIIPTPDRRRTLFLTGQRFAHRGLHGGDIVENSRAAFEAAIAADVGIECDVVLSADGMPFVFHDDTLERLTDREGPVSALGSAELAQTLLSGTEETIPSLEEMIALVAGRVPILIELKTQESMVGRLCLAVRRVLEGYRGPVAVMSFNPEVGHWYQAHATRITRGLIVSEEGRRGIKGAMQRHLSLWRARPDFLAYDLESLPSRFAQAQRERGIPVVTWTVRGEEAETMASEHADAPIFERQD